MSEIINKDQFQILMSFGVRRDITLTLNGSEKHWKSGKLLAFRILDFGYNIDITQHGRESIDTIKLPEPYRMSITDKTVEMDYRLETFLEMAPVGNFTEKFLRFKIKPENCKESRLSDRLLTITIV